MSINFVFPSCFYLKKKYKSERNFFKHKKADHKFTIARTRKIEIIVFQEFAYKYTNITD